MENPLLKHTTITQIAQLMANETPAVRPKSQEVWAQHQAMVVNRSIDLQNQGFMVSVDNEIMLSGCIYDICITGKPDIIATKDKLVVVENCNGGQRNQLDQYIILLYMMLLPHASITKTLCDGRIPHGRLVYWDEIFDLPSGRVDSHFRRLFTKILKQLSTQPLVISQANQNLASTKAG